MSIVNPGKAEVVMFIAMAKTIARSEYRKFVESMDLKGGESVMDFGSGPGVMAEMIAKRLGAGGNVTCVDISETWIGVAKRRLRELQNVKFALGDIRTMPIPPESFDVIGIHYVVHDIDPGMRQEVVNALGRALKRDGRIVVDEPRVMKHSMPPEEVKRLFAEAGMTEFSSRTNWMSYIGQFRKKA
jgi:ubiquinone/menaquinone biosynthesis C-methylase UbiE